MASDAQRTPRAPTAVPQNQGVPCTGGHARGAGRVVGGPCILEKASALSRVPPNLIVSMKNRLLELRTSHRLTQEALARAVGVSRQTMNAIETGRHLPSLPVAFGIARTFKVRIEDIFEPKA